MSEKILAHYFHDRQYLNEDQNAIGATTSLTLRDPDLVTGDESFVRKFGNDYLITEVTDIEDPGDPNMTFRIYALDGTLLGTMPDGGPFVPGATLAVAQPCYMEIEADGGNVVVLAGIDVETDVDTAPSLTFVCAAETIQDGDTLRLYLSDTASTYYDADYMYGGARHVPIATNERRPFFTITAGLAACAVPVDGVEVQDSETYDEQFVAENRVVAVLGQTPTITSGVGARVSREQANQGNNIDTAYVSKTGGDGDPGTYQEPYLTIGAAIAGIGARTNIHIMDSNTYVENITLNADIALEPLYGKLPIMGGTGDIITQTHADATISGITVSSGTNCFVCAVITPLAVVIQDCNLSNATNAGITIGQFDTTFYCYRTRIFSCLHGVSLQDPAVGDITNLRLFYCYVYNNTNGGIVYAVSANSAAQLNYNNCVVYGNGYGMKILSGGMPGSSGTGIITNSTVVNNNIGVYEDATLANVTAQVFNSIVYHNTTWDFQRIGVASVGTFEWSCYLLNSGFTDNGDNITTDPQLCKNTIPYKLGISSKSPCYRTDSAGNNRGAYLLRIIEINADDVIINGFNIDGQEGFLEGVFIADAVAHTGTIIRWSNVYDFQGIQIDPYGDGTDTNCIITNNKIYNGGDGIKLSYGGNTISENLFYNNAAFNLWSDYTGQAVTHNVFYGAQYGAYFGSSSAAITFRDNITHQNSLYGLYAENALIITYCDIADATYNVDATDLSNFTDDPNFINTNEDEENFRIKTIAGSYIVNSPCLLASSTGNDVGGYDVSRSITDDSWKKYSFFDNPMNLDDILEGKGVIKQDDALGSKELWMRSNKIQLLFRWGANQASNAEQRKKVRYFTQLVRSRENSLTLEQCKVRVHLLPITKLESGTAATIDATNKTISDTDKSWVENEHKGIHLAVIFTSGSGMVFDATAKTATKAGAGWTVNAWTGYTLYHNYDYYYILSNTATVLTLSDPNSTLEDETTTYSIELYFKICANSLNQIVVLDPDDELISGSYNYYIDFVEVRCTWARHQPKQAGYNPEHWAVGKTGYRWDTEEI